jgi:hypothetical protein
VLSCWTVLTIRAAGFIRGLEADQVGRLLVGADGGDRTLLRSQLLQVQADRCRLRGCIGSHCAHLEDQVRIGAGGRLLPTGKSIR